MFKLKTGLFLTFAFPRGVYQLLQKHPLEAKLRLPKRIKKTQLTEGHIYACPCFASVGTFL